MSIREQIESSESVVIGLRRQLPEKAAMWTPENQPKYDRSELHFPSDLTDEECSIIGPLIPDAKSGGNKRTIDVRAVLDGVSVAAAAHCDLGWRCDRSWSWARR